MLKCFVMRAILIPKARFANLAFGGAKSISRLRGDGHMWNITHYASQKFEDLKSPRGLMPYSGALHP
jgi:hypothetical protein